MAFIVSEQALLPIPYPWQQPVWERLQQQVNQDKVPHAILLAGSKGIGKWQLAHAFANFLLCASPRSALACGQCRHCQLIIAETHPDKKAYCPEEGGKTIKIEQIRELSAFVTKTAQQGGKKVVIIGPVEQLNLNAANALLKNLEEPAGDTVFILVSHVTSAVMATIRSRCQLVSLAIPEKQLAKQWLNTLQIDQVDTLLELAGDAPLVVQEVVQGELLESLEQFVSTLSAVADEASTVSSPTLSHASEWLNLDVALITEWWLRIIHRILINNKPVENSVDRLEGNINRAINRLLTVKVTNPQWLYKFSDKLVSLRQQHLQGANPNMQLVVEELLMDWHILMRQA